MARFVLCIHGGAGVIGRDQDTARIAAYRDGLSRALDAGRLILETGGKALDAVQAAVLAMEENPLFNAGRGAVYNSAGGHELDAAVMDGSSLACGAVAGLSRVRNPIRAARLVMERSGHVLLAGPAADSWAGEQGLQLVDNSWFDDPYRYEQWMKASAASRVQMDHADEPDSAKGTVGAVALDTHGHLAAATSTGGMTNKKHGRVGDTPIIGSGTYANDQSCAISCTGTGEQFMRHVVAHAIHARMSLAGESLTDACDHLVH
ncbi:MAG TPA: isoaspartyl peptidase/L-asparaginase, partial [Spirochaetales bacterium]|nr:isoaspartyl peptidase/L-asparaginase [Spirochaetales bacterium]